MQSALLFLEGVNAPINTQSTLHITVTLPQMFDMLQLVVDAGNSIHADLRHDWTPSHPTS